MAIERVDAAVVGAGPAGIAAARRLAASGLRVLLIDERPRPGGVYLAGARPGRRPLPGGLRRRGLALAAGLERAGVAVLSGAEAVGVEAGPVLWAATAAGELAAVACDCLVIATGGRERFIPFPGWTLPGVLAAGAVQLLLKQSGVLAAREIVFAGAGPFLSAAAAEAAAAGGRVRAVLDAAPLSRRRPPPALLLRAAPKFLLGGAALARLLFSGAVLRGGMRLLAARPGGGGGLEVEAARTGPDGRKLPGTAAGFRAGALAVGFGFSANVELAQLAGCELAFDPELGGWVVRVNAALETSVAGVFAAGEVTAVGGAAKAFVEGRLAALAILRALGRPVPAAEAAALKAARRREMAFARYFNAQSAFAPAFMAAWLASLPDELPLCRCEAATLGEVRRAVREGFATPAAVKKATRCGMGICQGATCRTILLEVLAGLTGRHPGAIPPPSVRPPLRPVALGTLAGCRPGG
jgi:NADPH-dependent 2,4-dienoyl-CoA reductase/sulfur reductase-like enzyme